MGQPPPTSADGTRSHALLALLGIAGFLVAGAFAAYAYPGGTHWHRTSIGPSWTNFFCDLLRPMALNGSDNSVGARAGQFALLALVLGLGPFFTVVRLLLGLAGPRLVVLMTGAYAGRIALILVAAGTGRLPPVVHDWSILIGAPLGLVALTLTVLWSWRLDRPAAWLGTLGLGLGLWNLTQYAREAVLHTPSWPGLPLVQKATLLCLLSFIALFSLRGLRR